MNRLMAIILLAAAVAVAGCSSSASTATAPRSVDPNAITISANGLAFSTSELSIPAGRPFQIVFENHESALHNVAIYTDSSASQPVFGEEPFGGPGQEVYDVPALSAGSYFFRCDVHPEMSGTMTAA
jgi:plastocyanin